MKSKPLRFKILLAAIALFCVLCVVTIAMYSPIIFQRGNPIPYLWASTKLDDNTPYVQVEQTDSSCVYITKRGVSDEVLNFFAESTGAELQERYGDTYIFSHGENQVIVESETYWKYYTVWELPVLMDTSDTSSVASNYFYGYYEAYIISLSDDSTYYCWCMLYNVPSERGTWSLDGDIVCLTGDGKDEASSVNYFRVDGNDLVYIAENSTGFSFMDIADGARIIGRSLASSSE